MSNIQIRGERWSQRAERMLATHWDVVWGLPSAVLLSASGLASDESVLPFTSLPTSWVLLSLGAIAAFFAAIAVARKTTSRHELEKRVNQSERDRAELQRSLDTLRVSTRGIMERLCEAFCRSMRAGATERVSIYRHNGDGTFVRLARFSDNPRFQDAGRVKYPDNEGVVGRAWAAIEAHEFIPAGTCSTRRQWANEMAVRSGIPKPVLRDMAMASNTLLAMRITDQSSRQPCAVLVFESTHAREELESQLRGVWGRSDIIEQFKAIFEESLGEALSEAVGILSRLELAVDPDLATREGF